VSITTVSRALDGDTHVAPATRERGSCPLPWCSSDMVVVLSGNAGR
jgi:hypothetical protein